MNENERLQPGPAPAEQQQNSQELVESTSVFAGSPLTGPMPQSEIDRWLLYLDEIDHGHLPAQASYDGWCDDCYKAQERGSEDVADPDLTTTSTAEVRSFLQRHGVHFITLWMHYDQEFSDLEPSTRAALRKNVIFRRRWIATMPDQELRELPFVGPKRFKHIRERIPYSGPPEAGVDTTSPKWERCPTYYGTGLKLSDTARTAVGQRVSDLETANAEANPPQPVPSIEESLMRLTSAIQEINSRLAVLEKDCKVGLSTPRILMSTEDAAEAVGVRWKVIWDAVMEGDLPFVRIVQGMPMVRSDALQEWLKWREARIEREPEPYVTPPELLCRKCGERPYYGRSAQLKLCQECHDQLKQERIEEKERKCHFHI